MAVIYSSCNTQTALYEAAYTKQIQPIIWNKCKINLKIIDVEQKESSNYKKTAGTCK